jgi:hypothetical protein
MDAATMLRSLVELVSANGEVNYDYSHRDMSAEISRTFLTKPTFSI